MIALRWNMRAETSCLSRSRISTCSAAMARPSRRFRWIGWAARHGSAAASKLKERITAIAGDLMQVAAERALKQATVLATDHASLNQFVDRFPWSETEDQERAIADVLGDLESGRPMDRLVCGDVGFGKTEVALRRGVRGGDGGSAGGDCRPHHPARAPALPEFCRTGSRASRSRSGGYRGWSRPKETAEKRAKGWRTARSILSSAPMRSCPSPPGSGTSAWSLSTRSSASA